VPTATQTGDGGDPTARKNPLGTGQSGLELFFWNWCGLERVNQRGTKSLLEAVRRSTIDIWSFPTRRSHNKTWQRPDSKFLMSKSGRNGQIRIPP